MKKLAFFYWVIGLLIFITSASNEVRASPLLKIVSPSDNQTVLGSNMTVSFIVGNAQVGKDTILHLWLDNPDTSSSTAAVINTHFDYVLSDVPPGDHLLILEAVKPDGFSFNPKIKEEVRFSNVIPQNSPVPTSQKDHIKLPTVDPRIFPASIGLIVILIGIILRKKSSF